MESNKNLSPFKHLKSDIPASVIVFLVAMPLCLGVALASGAPLYAGLISGIVGGIVVGALSDSPLGVSGPAAGLALIVLTAIQDLGSFELFLVTVVIAGVLQVIMGFLRAGTIAYYFPSSVVNAMLAGIGIIIFMKQIPHAVGYDENPEGNFAFQQPDGQNTISELGNMLNYVSPGVVIISVVSLAILILWEMEWFKRLSFTKFVKGPLVAVIAGIVLGVVFQDTSLAVDMSHFVAIPVANNMTEFVGALSFPDWANGLTNPDVYKHAVILAVIASLEGLLCAEASDKQDTLKRKTSFNRELKAEGVGNIISGLLGGLPLTQVIVRSSVNQQSGGMTKASAVSHGFLLLFSVLLIPTVLNIIPIASLAAILMVVGFKLAKPELFMRMYKQGPEQLIPFLGTVIAILLTDLLIGIGIGMVIAFVVMILNNYVKFRNPEQSFFSNINQSVVQIYNNYKQAYVLEHKSDGDVKRTRMVLSEDVTFLSRAEIQKQLKKVENGTVVEIDGTQNYSLHHDVMQVIRDFEENAQERSIKVKTTDISRNKRKPVLV